MLVADEHICKLSVCYVGVSFKDRDLVLPSSPPSASGPGRRDLSWEAALDLKFVPIVSSPLFYCLDSLGKRKGQRGKLYLWNQQE